MGLTISKVALTVVVVDVEVVTTILLRTRELRPCADDREATNKKNKTAKIPVVLVDIMENHPRMLCAYVLIKTTCIV